MVIFGVRWRIGFEYHSFCICFPKKINCRPLGGGEDGVRASGRGRRGGSGLSDFCGEQISMLRDLIGVSVSDGLGKKEVLAYSGYKGRAEHLLSTRSCTRSHGDSI